MQFGSTVSGVVYVPGSPTENITYETLCRMSAGDVGCHPHEFLFVSAPQCARMGACSGRAAGVQGRGENGARNRNNLGNRNNNRGFRVVVVHASRLRSPFPQLVPARNGRRCCRRRRPAAQCEMARSGPGRRAALRSAAGKYRRGPLRLQHGAWVGRTSPAQRTTPHQCNVETPHLRMLPTRIRKRCVAGLPA